MWEVWLLALGAMIIGVLIGFFLCALLATNREADAWEVGYLAGMHHEQTMAETADIIREAMGETITEAGT